MREFGVETIYPAHNQPIAGSETIDAAIDREQDYFKALRQIVREFDLPARSEEEIAKLAAQRLRPGKLWEQDRDNAKRALRELRGNS